MEKNLIKKIRNRRKVKSLGKTKKVGRGDRLVAKMNRTLKRYRGGDDSDYNYNKKGFLSTGRFSNNPNPVTMGIGQTPRMLSKLSRKATNRLGLTSKFNDGQYNKDVLAIDPTLEKTLKAKLYEYAYQYRDLLIRKYENQKNAENAVKSRADYLKNIYRGIFKNNKQGFFEYQHKFDDASYKTIKEELNKYLNEKKEKIIDATKEIDKIKLLSGQPGLSKAEQALTILQRDLGRIEKEIEGLDESRKKYIDECTSIDQGIKEFQTEFLEWAKGLSTDQPVTLEQDALKTLEAQIVAAYILTQKNGVSLIDQVTEKLDKFAKEGTESSADKVKNEKELPKKKAALAKMVEEQQTIEKRKKDFGTRQTELKNASKKEGTEYANTKILLEEIEKDLAKINAGIDALQKEISGSATDIKSHGDTTDRNEVSIQLLKNYTSTKKRADKELENNKTKQGSKLVFVLQLLSRNKTLLEANSAPSSFFSKRLYPIWMDSMDVLRKIVFSTFSTTENDDSSTPAIIGAVLAAISSEQVDGQIDHDDKEQEAVVPAEAQAQAANNGDATCTISPISIPDQDIGAFSPSKEKRYLIIFKEGSNTFLGITETIENSKVSVIAKVVTSETQYIEQHDYSAQKNNILSDYKDADANPLRIRCKITEMVTLLENRTIDTKAISYFIELKTPVSKNKPVVNTQPKKKAEELKKQAAKLKAEYKENSMNIVKEWFLMIETVYASVLPERKEIVDLYIRTNNTMHLTLSIPNDSVDKDGLLQQLQEDFIKVIKGERTNDDSCYTLGPGKEKVKRPMDPTSKEYKVDVDFFKRQFYELDPEPGLPIIDGMTKKTKKIIPTDDDPPFYHVHSKMVKKGKKYRGRSAFFAHMLDDFKTAEMSLWFLRHPEHKEEIAATRETVNVVSEDDTKAINKQHSDEINKFTNMQELKNESFTTKMAEE